MQPPSLLPLHPCPQGNALPGAGREARKEKRRRGEEKGGGGCAAPAPRRHGARGRPAPCGRAAWGAAGAAPGGCGAMRSSPRISGRVWFFPHSAFGFLRECIQPCSPPALWLSPRGSSPAARCGTAGRWAWPPQCVGGVLGAAAVLLCLNAAICNSQLIQCCSSGQSVQKRA